MITIHSTDRWNNTVTERYAPQFRAWLELKQAGHKLEASREAYRLACKRRDTRSQHKTHKRLIDATTARLKAEMGVV